MPRQYTLRNDGQYRTTVRASIDLTEEEYRDAKKAARKLGQPIRDFLSDCFFNGFDKAMVDSLDDDLGDE